MKILWFTNNAVNLIKNVLAGGWMQTLEHYLTLDDEIQLIIATRYNGQTIRRITEQKTTYILVPDRRNLLQKRVDVLLNREPIESYLKEYLKVIEEVEPDVIQVFGTEMDYGLIGRLTNIPVVIHIQGILHPYYYQLEKIHIPFCKKLFSQNIVDYIKGTTINNGLRIFKRRVGVEEKVLKACKYFIGRTDWDKRITDFLAPKAGYFHCDEMLRQNFFNADWNGNNNETLSIVSTISNPFYKGHETLLATCLVLKKAGIRFVWHVIGLNTKPTAYKVFYKKRIKSLTGSIQLHGMLKPEEIITILRHADVYVHPSHIENSSNSLCEAMAVGVPVIALHVGGNASIINHGEDGLLVADNDPYLLAATIKDVAEDKDKYRKMGHKAKRRAKERHNPESIINQLKQIYVSVIDSHANKK